MTERMIENRVKKLSTLENQIAELQEQAEAIKAELKAALPEIYNQYCRPSASRSFTIA